MNPGPRIPRSQRKLRTRVAQDAPATPSSPGSPTTPGSPQEASEPQEIVAETPQAPVAGTPVAAAVEAWRTRLVELAGGSALWDVDTLGDAVVELTAAHPSGVAQLFAGRRTPLSNLAREGSALTQARRRARIVAARTEDLAQRYGVAPTYVAMGVASWRHVEEPVDPAAEGIDVALEVPGRMVHVPVLLRPVEVTMHGPDGEIELELDPAVEVNSVLVRALRAAGAQVDPTEVALSTHREHGFSPRPALDTIEALGAVLPQFSLEPRIVLGAFVHPGQALADDLDAQAGELAGHEVVRALAGEEVREPTLTRSLPAVRLADPDPEDERGVGDLDPGQHRILDALAGGGHLLIDAPPGVGVPATVAALLAQAAKEGKRSLYVPGTRRAGAALVDALRALGLDRLALDLSNDSGWRSGAARRVVDGLNPDLPEAADDRAMREELLATREKLATFVGALHTPREPWGVSAYHALQALAELTAARPGPRTQVHLPASTVRSMDGEARTAVREQLARAAGLGAFRLRASDTPWFGANLRDADHARDTMERVGRLAESVALVREQAASTAAQTGLDEAGTLGEWIEQLDLLDGIRASLDLFTPEVFERSVADMVTATAPTKDARQELTLGARRRLRKQAKDLLRPSVPVEDLHVELTKVAERRAVWRKHCSGGGWPRLPEGMRAITETVIGVTADVDALRETLRPTVSGRDLADVPLPELQTKLERLAGDEAALRQMPERAGLLAGLAGAGLGDLLTDLSQRRVPTDLVGAEFDLAWWSAVLEQILLDDPAHVGFDASVLDETVTRLRALDGEQVASLRAPVLAAHARHVRAAIAADRPRAQDFYRAVMRGESDLRSLQQRFGTIAWAPRPIWIVPPMVVPQVMPAGREVDLVVLDAVQHLPVEQVISAVVRGRQVVVVGDTRRGGEDLVEAVGFLPALELPGDRADQDTEIAAFLVRHGYTDALAPVPAPPRPTRIRLDHVDGTGMPALGSDAVESVQAEVDHVVDLVIDHALTRPEESLAVIALNTRHADRIREAVAATAAGSSAVVSFFDPSAAEAFTVVDVEGAAGLHRDAVILSVGYGKTPHGRVLHRFGAVSGPHGAGLLVDALDAVRHRLTVVSCLRAEDLDGDRLRTPGSQLLHDVLEFAGQGGVAAQTQPIEDDTPDRLLVDLAERLWRLGLQVVPRYGVPGGVRIPLAIGDPRLPGELLLAVLTDDAEYVSEASLRRRDRHWVERLEARGWCVRTVYSTAVFMDPQGEARRIADAVNEIVAERLGTAATGLGDLTPPLALDDWDDPVEPEDGADEDPAEEEAEPLPRTGAQPVYLSVRSETIAGPTTASIPVIVTPGRRGPRPGVEPGRPLHDYGDDELDAVVSWLGSDGRARSNGQYLEELRSALGFAKRGIHLDAVLGAAVARANVPRTAAGEPESVSEDTIADEPEGTDGPGRGEPNDEPGRPDDGPAGPDGDDGPDDDGPDDDGPAGSGAGSDDAGDDVGSAPTEEVSAHVTGEVVTGAAEREHVVAPEGGEPAVDFEDVAEDTLEDDVNVDLDPHSGGDAAEPGTGAHSGADRTGAEADEGAAPADEPPAQAQDALFALPEEAGRVVHEVPPEVAVRYLEQPSTPGRGLTRPAPQGRRAAPDAGTERTARGYRPADSGNHSPASPHTPASPATPERPDTPAEGLERPQEGVDELVLPKKPARKGRRSVPSVGSMGILSRPPAGEREEK